MEPPPTPIVETIPPPSESFRVRVTGLDPILVLLYDLRPGEGRIIIECCGEAMSAYWPAMGNANIRKFVRDVDPDYLSGRLISPITPKSRIRYLRRVVSAVQTAIRSMP